MTAVLPPAAVFDTPLILSFRAMDDPAMEFAGRWVDSGRKVTLSRVTALALLARCPNEDDRRIQIKFLTESEVLSLTAPVSERAERILRAHPVPTRLTADDALVAATALIHKLPVYSLDPERYAAVPGLTALPAR